VAVRAAAPTLVVDKANSIAGAAELAKERRGYRLVLLDLLLPDAKGFSGFLRLQNMLGPTPIAIVTALRRPELIEAARALGAAGFLSKQQPVDEMAGAIRDIIGGRLVFPPPQPNVSASAAANARERIADLSAAQLRVLLAMADGRLNKQIAGDLGVTEATIKAHLTAIFRKLGVTNRTQALLAMQPLLGEGEQGEEL
jgi:DNA-binding NarL/FixJ family response regulator